MLVFGGVQFTLVTLPMNLSGPSWIPLKTGCWWFSRVVAGWLRKPAWKSLESTILSCRYTSWRMNGIVPLPPSKSSNASWIHGNLPDFFGVSFFIFQHLDNWHIRVCLFFSVIWFRDSIYKWDSSPFLGWRKFQASWDFPANPRNGSLATCRIVGVCHFSAPKAIDYHHGLIEGNQWLISP